MYPTTLLQISPQHSWRKQKLILTEFSIESNKEGKKCKVYVKPIRLDSKKILLLHLILNTKEELCQFNVFRDCNLLQLKFKRLEFKNVRAPKLF